VLVDTTPGSLYNGLFAEYNLIQVDYRHVILSGKVELVEDSLPRFIEVDGLVRSQYFVKMDLLPSDFVILVDLIQSSC
jgi:hypothetical protein